MAETGSKISTSQERGSLQPSQRPGQARPWRPFDNLRSEIDRLFEDFGQGWSRSLGGFPSEAFFGRGLSGFANPAVDIVDKPDCLELSAELPGMDEKNVELKLVGDTLVIRGEKKDEREEKSGESYLSERRFGSFQRAFPLPEGVDADKIEATFNNGVLKISVPKKPEAQKAEKKIEIKNS